MLALHPPKLTHTHHRLLALEKVAGGFLSDPAGRCGSYIGGSCDFIPHMCQQVMWLYHPGMGHVMVGVLCGLAWPCTCMFMCTVLWCAQHTAYRVFCGMLSVPRCNVHNDTLFFLLDMQCWVAHLPCLDISIFRVAHIICVPLILVWYSGLRFADSLVKIQNCTLCAQSH